MPWRSLWERLARQSVRDNEVSLIAISALISIAIGLGVIVLQALVLQLHQVLFAVAPNQRLSGTTVPDWWRVLLVPCVGGLLSGVATVLIRRWRPREIVDAIEANALYGGKMSLIDSANLALLTVISSGFGASVGLEAAYTQLGSGMASRFGQILKMRRSDLRTLVGCGAAAGIAAAFNAPLAGAFYAFELVIGNYSPAVLAPVSMAALSSTLVVRALYGTESIFGLDAQVHITGTDFALFAGLGVLAAVIAIATMTGVTRIERFLRRQALPRWVSPAIGGFVVGMIATIYQEVLGSGHGALQLVLENSLPWAVLLGLIAAKGLASAVSVGAGFRGGLFSSSLLLGAVFGGAAVVPLQGALHLIGFAGLELDRVAYMLVGMGAVAAAVVGAPLTMIFLVLELTGSFPAALGVMVGVIIASLVVRQTFGYSFATWRFHVRGVPIRGGFDVGWIEDLSVGKMMRRDAPTVPLGTTVGEFRKRFPLGGPNPVFLVEGGGRYAGIVTTADAYNPDLDQKLDQPIDELRTTVDQFLLPEQNVRTALRRFSSSETETLAVVSDAKTLHVVGFLTEGYALRRYSQELERSRAEELGEHSLYGPA
ncbi:MAG TPA: chloride channel protein [Stellaceae bacterium]|nr:chloride channel protein [Stellaceae bacterium]